MMNIFKYINFSFILILFIMFSCEESMNTSSRIGELEFYDIYGNTIPLNELNNPQNHVEFNPNIYDQYEININLETSHIYTKIKPIDNFIHRISISGNLNLQRGESEISIKVISEDESSNSEYKFKLRKFSNDTKLKSDIHKFSYVQGIIYAEVLQAKKSFFTNSLIKPDSGQFDAKYEFYDLNGNILSEEEWLYPDNTIVKVTADNGFDVKEYTLKFFARDTFKLIINNHKNFFDGHAITDYAKNSFESNVLEALKNNNAKALKIYNWLDIEKYNSIKEYFVSNDIIELRIFKGDSIVN